MKKNLYLIMALIASAIAFTSCNSVPDPYDNPNGNKEDVVPGVKEGTGTEADPYNVTAALEKIKALKDGENTGEIFVKGKIVSINEIDTDKFGNATYYISVDGTDKNQLCIYRSKALGNQKFTSKDAIKVGDEVVVKGIFVNFKGNKPESEANKSYLYSLNGKKEDNGGTTPTPGEEKGSGTQADPYNVAAALAKIKTLKTDKDTLEFYVKGKIVNAPSIDTKYGNATYHISDDGTTNNQLLIFRSLDLNNQKFTKTDALKAGDEVVVTGKFVNFKGNTPETAGNKSYLVSLKPGTGGGGGPIVTPSGLTINGNTVTAVNSAVTAGTESITVTMTEQGWADKAAVTKLTLSDGTTIAFDTNGEKSVPSYYAGSKGVRVYKNNGITITGKKAIAKLVFTCDVYNGTNQVGNQTATIAFTGNTAVYKNVFNEPKGGGVQLRVQTITITYAQ
jgi:lipoprotein